MGIINADPLFQFKPEGKIFITIRKTILHFLSVNSREILVFFLCL